MTNEDIIKYKEKINNLSTEDKRKRELEYLRKIAKGNIQGPMIGYPSLDLPQIAQYSDDYLDTKIQENHAKALIDNNEDNLDTIALKYFGKDITYREFIENIKSNVKALRNYGTEKGQSVGILLPGMPETMYTLYGSAWLGSVSIFMVPYLEKDQMVSDFKLRNTKTLIVMDKIYKKAKKTYDYVIEKAGIEHVVIVPTLNSSKYSKLQRLPKLKDPRFEYYNEFIEKGKDTPLPEMAAYEKKMPGSVVYSSGTSGILKGVLLTHDSFNNIASSYKAFGFHLDRGQTLYQAIPPWTSTGLITVGTIPLFYGQTLYQNFIFEPVTFCRNVGKYGVNWPIGTTELFKGLAKLKNRILFKIGLLTGKYKYSQLYQVHIGGTFASRKDMDEIDQIFHSLGSEAETRKGYGRCEDGSIVTCELPGEKYPEYSVGRPLPESYVIAIDEKGNELPYGERGELAIRTENGMISYYNRPDLDTTAFFTDKGTGYKYNLTGDIGYVQKDGVIIYESRKSDYSEINGKRIFNFDVKRSILNDDDVFDCEVYQNNEGKLCANIIFVKDKKINSTKKILELQKKVLLEFDDINFVPTSFKIRKSFPMAKSTKRDYKKLKEETKGFNDYPFEEKGHTLKKAI